MIKNIQDIFNAITPENIKNITVIADAMEIFIEVLEELSQESINIKNVFNNSIIKNELYQIYLNDLFNVLNSVSTNKQLLDAIDAVNAIYNPVGLDPSDSSYVSYINKDALVNIADYINDEQFLTFKSFKEHKGTIIAIKYIYQLLNIFTDSSLAENNFTLIEGSTPFEIESIYGGLPSEFYEYIIRPLAHPLGFLYEYSRSILAQLEDYFPEINITYITELLRVVCLQDDASIDYYTFIDEDASPPISPELTVLNIENFITGTTRVQKIYLDDGAGGDGDYLQQTTTDLGQTTVALYNSSDILQITYVGQCSIEINYEQTIETTVTDEAVISQNPFLEETIDTFTENYRIDAINENALETHTEMDSHNGEWWDLIGDHYIFNDNGWIYYKEINIETAGDSYMQLGVFDQRSDDDFDFGVYTAGGVRIVDNNISALP